MKKILTKKIDIFNKIDRYSEKGMNTDNSALNQAANYILHPFWKWFHYDKFIGRTLKGKIIYLLMQLLAVAIGILIFIGSMYLVLILNKFIK